MKSLDKPRAGSYDLHCHSLASDGAWTPRQVVDTAYERGVRVLALTDHDTLDGLPEASSAASQYPDLEFVPGTELSCLWNGRVIHVVGLGFDVDYSGWPDYLQMLADLRIKRAKRIAGKLRHTGIEDLFERAKKLTAGDGVIGRPHFAKVLVESKVVSTEQEAFERFLGRGRLGDVKAEWPEIEVAVKQIKAAGGIAVLAHPTKYHFSFSKLRKLAEDFIAFGGQGIEVSFPGVSPNHQRDLLLLAERCGLVISAGSDFHSPEQHWTGLGRYPGFDRKTLTHVLDQLFGNGNNEI